MPHASSAHVLIICRRAVVMREAAAIAAAVADFPHAQASIAVGEALAPRLLELVPPSCRLITLNGEPVRMKAEAEPKLTPVQSAPGLYGRLKQAALSHGATRAGVMILRARADVQRARRLLSQTQANAVVLFDDRALGDMALIRAARQACVRTVLAPYASSSPESDAASRLKGQVDHRLNGRASAIKRVMARFFPHEVRDTPHGRMLFFRTSDYPALAIFGLLGGRSWLWGGGKADAVCVFGRADRDILASEGVDPAKIHVTGQASLDLLFARAARRDDLRRDLKDGDDRPLIVCAVPQSAEHGQLDWPAHKQATLALFDALQDSGARVLLSLHPRSQRAYYDELAASRPALSIASEPLEMILPAADLFVATYSSTVRWAMLLGIPSIIIDPAELRYTMFDGQPGVTILRDEAEWSPAFRAALVSGSTASTPLANTGASVDQLGPRDGLASRRIAAIALTGSPDTSSDEACQVRPV